MNFDTLAPHYRNLETALVGNILQGCRTAFLDEIRNCRRALGLGEGPGRFLVELLGNDLRVEVTCVEHSRRMNQETQSRLSESDYRRVRFEQADALTWQPRGKRFDLIATHFFLDCFSVDQVKALVAKAAASLKPDARWLLADFRMPERGWRRWRAHVLLTIMYRFFRIATGWSAERLTPPARFLEASGFRLAARWLTNFDFARSDLRLRGAP